MLTWYKQKKYVVAIYKDVNPAAFSFVSKYKGRKAGLVWEIGSASGLSSGDPCGSWSLFLPVKQHGFVGKIKKSLTHTKPKSEMCNLMKTAGFKLQERPGKSKRLHQTKWCRSEHVLKDFEPRSG